MQKYYDYFLGTTAPGGFADFFRQLCDNASPLRTYIIKTGPGCGKSTMMRRIGARIIKEGYSIEFIHCSSDPDSLDGLICHQLGFAIVDGTAPHGVGTRGNFLIIFCASHPNPRTGLHIFLIAALCLISR